VIIAVPQKTGISDRRHFERSDVDKGGASGFFGDDDDLYPTLVFPSLSFPVGRWI
jgi:hypothetical protein